ncbi:MAG TPA: exodeoxyribonuclease III [Porphyromonadaceae bacterium]|nr:exodeoxyribonuclease III [Porphyromonadaceae bacterium]
MKLISWNVNGIRAIAKKSFFDHLQSLQCDILCLQETKAQDDQVAETLSSLEGFHVYSHSAERKGYSGTAILSKTPALNISFGIGIDEHDKEGRVITAEFSDFYLVNVYVPNSGSELLRLDYRQTWDKAFFEFLKNLEKTKPVIVCGDMNVAHKPIDIARPKANYNKTAGFMQEEIDGMDRYTQGGFIDTFRALYPDKTDMYSWWSYRGGARAKNIGWRIDYFLVSENFQQFVKEAFIYPDIDGSDHCPVGIEIKL